MSVGFELKFESVPRNQLPGKVSDTVLVPGCHLFIDLRAIL